MSAIGRKLTFVCRAVLVAPVVELSLKRWGLKKTMRWVERSTDVLRKLTRPASRDRVDVDDGARLVRRAFRFVPRSGLCLPRSIVQYGLHRVDGLAVRLVVGVKPPEGAGPLDAHAWVEPLGRPADEAFESIAIWEAPPPARVRHR